MSATNVVGMFSARFWECIHRTTESGREFGNWIFRMVRDIVKRAAESICLLWSVFECTQMFEMRMNVWISGEFFANGKYSWMVVTPSMYASVWICILFWSSVVPKKKRTLWFIFYTQFFALRMQMAISILTFLRRINEEKTSENAL